MESEMSKWNPTQTTLRSISRQTDLLIKQFSSYIADFDKATEEDRTFGGPSLYFHYMCICNFAQVSIAAKLNNLQFYEYLYATLASWGMHRMGNTATKLRNFAQFRSQIFAQRETLAKLESFKIWSLTEQELTTVQSILAGILDEMTVSKAEAHLVANTKILHHILPDLVPPIDRHYTLAYFGINETLPSQKSAGSIFVRLFPSFVRVSTALAKNIQSKIDISRENWHTSFTKVIDNAVIGALT
jgi:hypothetical protein